MLKVGACLFRSTQRMAGVHGGVGFHRRGGMSCGFAAEATKVAEGGEGETAEVNADLEMKKAFLSSMVEMCPKWIKSARIEKASLQINQGGEMVLSCEPENIAHLVGFLKRHTSAQFRTFTACTGADYPQRSDRFRVIYNLLSPRFSARIRVETYVNEITPIESSTKWFNGANWFEREVWDMYGVFFRNHPDLRRILTDYGFEGHPLRKDFPLSGYVEVRYDEAEKRVINEPVEITQEYRSFDYTSPWEVFPEDTRSDGALLQKPDAK